MQYPRAQPFDFAMRSNTCSIHLSPLLLLLATVACGDDGSAESGLDTTSEADTATDTASTTDDEVGSESESTETDAESSESESEATETEAESSESDAADGPPDTDADAESSESDSADDDPLDTETDSESSSAESTTTGNACVECGVTLDSTQSSSFEALPGTDFIGYATLEGDEIIYALDEVGSGRVIYTADTNLLYEEITDCPLWEWLGQSGDQLPKVLSFGRYLCGGTGNSLASYPDLTYAGDDLPAQYIGDPAALAADYDAVIYCTLASTTAAEAQTIVDYVNDYAGGLYLASEYWGFINQGDLDSVNAIANPLGVDFQATNLDWGQANGDIAFDCFPDPQ
ncbi:hypothetical protein G6O69_20545 [Pseudenhygromyxa sp. WMMC2535]|uniref:hypothetical protein n=1 Tax=Pseudenhygromyxa sp. WMMC2535 TaxID=2712867 RepID=UPI001595F799|nr:hypothetical protein [Pseudenhygromyxa sp. WMMC2535]NVB40244.1 hypothetical protein [Pseudenhygromyxa sp. WMMC2535]